MEREIWPRSQAEHQVGRRVPGVSVRDKELVDKAYLVGLPLGVDHERPSSGVEDDYAVVHAKAVRREPVDVPLPHQHGISERT